jgi:glycosyltransferase involved in cell wall biosynthesis
VIAALGTLGRHRPPVYLLLVGEAVPYHDLRAEAERAGVGDRVVETGYVADAELPDYLCAADACVCLRWPTARETSASWLRCLAAGKPTIVTDLAHTATVPTLDPRTWTANTTAAPIALRIDLLDEDHSLRLAMRGVVRDQQLREDVGRAARAWWRRHHTVEGMAADYQKLIEAAEASPPPARRVPLHLSVDGSEKLHALLECLGMRSPI